MSDQHCPTCSCSKAAPEYPVTCQRCGITYGRGGEVDTHRPGSPVCQARALSRAGRDLVELESQHRQALIAAKRHAALAPAAAPEQQLCGLMAYAKDQCTLSPGHGGGCKPRARP